MVLGIKFRLVAVSVLFVSVASTIAANLWWSPVVELTPVVRLRSNHRIYFAKDGNLSRRIDVMAFAKVLGSCNEPYRVVGTRVLISRSLAHNDELLADITEKALSFGKR
jgi:hypothetical protein